MAAAEKKQRPQATSPQGENAAHAANQVPLKSPLKPLGNDAEKGPEGVDTAENKDNTTKKSVKTLKENAADALDTQLHEESPVGFVGADPAAKDDYKDTSVKTADPSTVEEAPVPMDVDSDDHEANKDVMTAEVLTEQAAAHGSQEGRDEKQLASEREAGMATAASSAVDAVAASCKTVSMDVTSGTDAAEATSMTVEEVRPASVASGAEGNGAGDVAEESPIAMEVDSGGKHDAAAVEGGVTPSLAKEAQASGVVTLGGEDKATTANGASEDVDMGDTTLMDAAQAVAGDKLQAAGGKREQLPSDSDVAMVVGQIVTSLVDNVVDFVAESVTVDEESVKIISSPLVPHLSADEAMELLEFHQGDDHELLPEHDDGADADVEVAPTANREYQWFDGDDEDDEGAAIEVASSLEGGDATDDVFGFGSVADLSNVAPKPSDDAENSDASVDTQVLPNSSSSSSSSSGSSSASSGSSSSSSSSESSASEDEAEGVASKKRHVSGSSGPRKLLVYKKQKRERASESDKSPRRRYKRKRKIPEPVIPEEFRVFDTAAADPILKGSYAVRNNRRACFVGNWGFSDDAFQNMDSTSPFEYTSRTRVPQSRRKKDKRPVSGKYGGFFKLRQFNGKMVKIREDQVDLQFLPLPSSDGEDDEEMESCSSSEDDEEPAAKAYVVLGKGKNRFGRFLIRGYLNPESGRLTVKRRYLE